MRILVSIMLGSILMSSSLAYAEDAATAVVRAGVSAAFDEAEKQIIYKYFKDYVKEKDDYAHEHDYDEHKSKHKKNKKKKRSTTRYCQEIGKRWHVAPRYSQALFTG